MQSFLGHLKPPQSSSLFLLFGPGLPFRSRKSLSLFLKSTSLDSGINPSSFSKFKLSSSRPRCDLLACPAAVCGFEFGAVRSEGWSSELRVSTNFIRKLSRSFCNSSSWKQQREGRVTARPAAQLSQRVCAEAERRQLGVTERSQSSRVSCTANMAAGSEISPKFWLFIFKLYVQHLQTWDTCEDEKGSRRIDATLTYSSARWGRE